MSSTLAQSHFTIPHDAPAAARTALRLMRRLVHGQLTVQTPSGVPLVFGQAGGSPQATIELANWNVCSAALKSGDIGFAETFIAGDWNTPSLTALLRLFLRNRAQVEAVIHGHWLGKLLYQLRHLRNRNTRRGSSRNIQAHYDLGNAFYALWLDGSMNYSSALFEGQAQRPMHEAQAAKVRRALRMARVTPGSRLLEIGCGWGALAETAAREFGAAVTGVTISREQLDFARQRLAGAPGVDLRLQDYRDIDDGPYDAICSIEMVEAVGRAYWPTYFGAVARLLKPGGRACIQSIVMDDALWPQYARSTDFIQQYIFPGGLLPCPAEFRKQAQAAGLVVEDAFAFGADYALTLAHWRERFLAERAQVLALGFDERFMRIWEFYLAYCEAAFAERSIDVVQYTLLKE